MDIRKLQRAIIDGLEDVKAQDIVIYNTEHLSSMFERVVIASGTSNRQTKALAASVRDAVRKQGMPVLSVEGEDNGEWIIVDCGAAVAHIMQPAVREYYHLEEIWGGKAVKMKLGGAVRGLVKASEPDEAPAAPARKRAAKAAPRSAAQPAAKPAAKPAGKPPAKSAPSKAAPSKAPAARKAAPAPARKAAAKPAPAKKAPARKAPAAKKAPRAA